MDATTADLVSRDLYLRHTDTEGRSTVREHRVWNAALFLAARAAEADKLNADVKDRNAPRLAKVEVITPAEYRKERT